MLIRCLRRSTEQLLFQNQTCSAVYKALEKACGRETLPWNSKSRLLGSVFIQSKALFYSARPDDLTKALSDAEKLVGYPTSFLSLRCLLSDELSNAAVYVKKLINSEHPLLNTAREFVFDGQYGFQTRGLLVLLIAKAAGPKGSSEEILQDPVSGIYSSQRQLAEITEMIHTANLIHSGVVDLAAYHKPEQVQDMVFGNRLAVLSGDFLLANACTGLAQLHNTEVVDMISKVIGHMMEGEMMSCYASTVEDLTLDHWKDLVFKCKGSLIASSCKAALKLVSHNEQLQESAFYFGRNISYAHQLKEELQNLRECKVPLSMITGPIILSMEEPGTSALVQSVLLNNNTDEESKEASYRKLQEHILNNELSDRVNKMTRYYGDEALSALSGFPQSDAKAALQNIALTLTQ